MMETIQTWAENHIWELVWIGVGVGTIWMAFVFWWAYRHDGPRNG